MLKPGETGETDHMVMIIIMTEESIFVVTELSKHLLAPSPPVHATSPGSVSVSEITLTVLAVCRDLVNIAVVTLPHHVSVSLSITPPPCRRLLLVTGGDCWRLVETGL